MTCNEIRRLLPQYLGLELPAAVDAGVREHVSRCAACRESLTGLEPTLVFTFGAAEAEAPSEEFTQSVMAGIHQRRFERRVSRQRLRWVLGAAAAVLLALTGVVAVHETTVPTPQVAAHQPSGAAPAAEPAFVEVDGDGVRVYEMAGGQAAPVQVAFIVDPRMEL